MSSPRLQTPRPKPFFFQPKETFSTKKERGSTPKDSAPPRPPMKSAPPISRIFPRKQLIKAAPVSFKSPDKSAVLTDSFYNEGKRELYFDQCFDIESKLGIGSFGEVFKVRSKEDGQSYAVKRSRQRFRGESDRQRRFEEVDKHEMLPVHPNCVRFIKAWEEKQFLYIQTELCKTSLNSFAEENHDIPERLVWNYLVDLLMAVKHLHDHDLVHMDIKPENIFISYDNTCKLGDFGLVIDLKKDVEISEAQEGDPKYLAPELMLSRFGKPADVFSVGITMLELASDLDLPRGGDLWHKLRSGELPEEFLIGVSSELKEIIRWMMKPDPAQRPTVDQVLAHQYITKIWCERRQEQLDKMLEESSGAPTQMMLTPVKVGSPMKRPPEWDRSYSDDELLDHHGATAVDDIVYERQLHRCLGPEGGACVDERGGPGGANMSNGSLGVPLNFSTSSSSGDEAFPHSLLPRQKAATTPSYRMRRHDKQNSSGCVSPIFASSGSFLSSSPVSSVNAPTHPTPLHSAASTLTGGGGLASIPIGWKRLGGGRAALFDEFSSPTDCAEAGGAGGGQGGEGGSARRGGSRTAGGRSLRFEGEEGAVKAEFSLNPLEPKNLLKAFEYAEEMS